MSDEKYISIAEAAKQMPFRISKETIRRWIDTGINGHRFMKAKKFGARWFVKIDELIKFAEEVK